MKKDCGVSPVCIFVLHACQDSYTCILYMNDNDWDLSSDGGELRLYFNTKNIYNPMDVVTDNSTHYDFVDISPTNGRLLIFDSCLVHRCSQFSRLIKNEEL
jgi:Rps23 Pro-64 3,4-dihydroxylase Tpa1-like proline 4-hydroxylase